jgi:hypothetical protein
MPQLNGKIAFMGQMRQPQQTEKSSQSPHRIRPVRRRWQGPSNFTGLWIYFAIAGIASANAIGSLIDISMPSPVTALSSKMQVLALLIVMFYLMNLIYLAAGLAAAAVWRAPVVTVSLGFGPEFYSYRGKGAVFRFAMLPLGGYLKFAAHAKPWARLTANAAAPSLLVMVAWLTTGFPPLEQARFLFAGLIPLLSHPLTVPTEFWLSLASFISQNSPARLLAYMCVCFGVFNFIPLPSLSGGNIIIELLRISGLVKGEPRIYTVLVGVYLAVAAWITGLLLIGLYQFLVST